MRRSALALFVVLAGCADDDPEPPPGPDPLFPADYTASYSEVRDCRQSGTHDLNVIRVLADPTALDPYQNRDAPIPAGGILLKEEYDSADPDCTGPIKQWTVMMRLEDGSSPDTLDWRWQRVDAAGQVAGEDTPKCIGCHTGCTPDVNGYDHTCTVP